MCVGGDDNNDGQAAANAAQAAQLNAALAAAANRPDLMDPANQGLVDKMRIMVSDGFRNTFTGGPRGTGEDGGPTLAQQSAQLDWWRRPPGQQGTPEPIPDGRPRPTTDDTSSGTVASTPGPAGEPNTGNSPKPGHDLSDAEDPDAPTGPGKRRRNGLGDAYGQNWWAL